MISLTFAAAPAVLLEADLRCRNHGCEFANRELFIDIHITNRGAREVGVPLAYFRSGGPILKLTNVDTGVETFVRRMPVNLALAHQWTRLAANETVSMEYVVFAEDLLPLEAERVHRITVEATLTGEFLIDNSPRTVSLSDAITLFLNGADLESKRHE